MTKAVKTFEDDAAQFIVDQEKVVREYLKGESDYVKLGKLTGFQPKYARQLVEDYREVVMQSNFSQEAKMRLHEMNEHFSMLIKDAYSDVEELRNEGKHKDALNGLNIIAGFEAKRADMLQKAGMFEDNEIAEMLEENERKNEQVVKLLQRVMRDFPGAKSMIIAGLEKIENGGFDSPEVIDEVV